MNKEIVPDITSDYYNPELTENQIIIKKLKQIMNQVDSIAEKMNQLNDPYNLNDYFQTKNTMVESTSSCKLSDRYDVTEH